MVKRKVKIAAIICAAALPCVAFLPVPVPGVGIPVYDQMVGFGVGLDVAANASTLIKTITIADLALSEYQRIRAATRAGWVNVLEQLPGVAVIVSRRGETTGLGNVMNGQIGIAGTVWQRATIAIDPNPQVWDEQPPGTSKHLAHLATVEAMDDSSSRCWDQIAQARGNWAVNNPMALAMSTGIIDESDGFNGTVGQINLSNAALAQGNAERRIQTAIQACLSEAAILQNKAERDRIANAMNEQTLAMQQQASLPTTYDGGTTFGTPIF